MRRRRRRGAGMSRPALLSLALIAAAAALGAFLFFLHVADTAEPAREEIRMPLPDAFQAQPTAPQ